MKKTWNLSLCTTLTTIHGYAQLLTVSHGQYKQCLVFTPVWDYKNNLGPTVVLRSLCHWFHVAPPSAKIPESRLVGRSMAFICSNCCWASAPIPKPWSYAYTAKEKILSVKSSLLKAYYIVWFLNLRGRILIYGEVIYQKYFASHVADDLL